jgi:DNA-binding SARP family transcriptional activator
MWDSDIAELLDESINLEWSGDIGAAFRQARQALNLARSRGEPPAIAEALVCLAKMRFRVGQFQAARSLAEEALTLAAPDAVARAEALFRLGACASETDYLAEAEVYYHQAADLAREISHYLIQLAAVHCLAASVYIPRGQFDLALATDEEAYRIAHQHDLGKWLPVSLITMAQVCICTGQRQRARQVLDELGRAVIPASAAQGYYHWHSAELLLSEGDTQAALALYPPARSIAEATGEPALNIVMRLGLSRTHRAAGDASAARAWANDALSWARRLGFRHEGGNALIERARAAWLCNDTSAADADLRAAIEVLVSVEAAFDLARARLFLAALLHQTGHAEAEAAWREAVRSLIEGGYTFLLEQERAIAFPLVAAYLASPKPEVREPSVVLLSYLERVPPPALRIVTLGRFQVYRRGQPIPASDWRRKAGELFRLLLISPGRTLGREQIVEVLWPEKSQVAATEFFHQATSALRRALEPDLPDKFPSRYLLVEEGQVTLCLPPDSRVDYEIFEQHIRQEEWESALSLYRGEPFPQDRYRDWVSWKREQLVRGYIRALLAVADQKLTASEPDQALEACQRILAEDPWQERAVLLGMNACIQMEDRAGALKLYRDLERRLGEELGVGPQLELIQLFETLQ